MGKHKRKLSARVEAVAERHDFSAGLLGHDLSASQWLINVSEQTALALDTVFACVRVISDAVAGSDVGQWRGTEKIEPPSTFALRPDPDLTRREFLSFATTNLALYNAVYVEEATFAGDVIAIRLHAVPSVIRVGSDYYVGGQRITNRMKLWRRIIFPTISPDVGTLLSLAREVFAGAMAANAYQSDFWQQGGAPVLYLKTEQRLTDDQAEGIQDRWVSQRTTSPGKPAVVGFGNDIKQLGADLGTEGANIAADKLRASAARYLGVPPSIVNVPSEAGSLTYSTTEQEGIHLVRYTIQPYCDVIGEGLSEYLPGDYLLGDRIVIDPRRLTMADQLTRFQAWSTATGNQPWMDPQEVRALEGLGPRSIAPIEVPANVGR